MSKILVVDDEPAVTHLLRWFLEKKGHEVVTAADGVEALASVQQENPKVVLLDISMPLATAVTGGNTLSHSHADKWGPLGSIFAALCCLGAAPALAAVSALGLGFLINDIILIPLLVVFLGATIWALRRDRSRHGRTGPQRLAWLASLFTVSGLWVSGVVVSLGLILLVAASIWNVVVTWQTKFPLDSVPKSRV
ncbi:MAG: response regulator [Acidobacteria bacterium]|nr:response regulator [Acidobacteriota bacterium]